jgi:hypothetical protein
MPAKLKDSPIDRLLSKVLCDVQTRCWNFVGGHTVGGYGVIVTTPQREERAHRVAYRELVGPIPDRAVLHHTCENTRCCNPAHLQPSDIGVHVAHHKAQAQRDECPKGHALTDDNLVPSRLRRGARICLTCQRAAIRANYHQNKDEWKARAAARRAQDPEKAKADARRYQAAHRARKRLAQG